MGEIAVEIAFNAVRGQAPEEPIIRLDPDPIMPDNVDDIFHWANAVMVGK
ncbi:unnamed protein product [marine sediment metagenome]|uniref:Uncharacterized protein n=1 Tax=marine sediment metagenome TaxID=412755 RepID=X1LDT7_9ZZZZ